MKIHCLGFRPDRMDIVLDPRRNIVKLGHCSGKPVASELLTYLPLRALVSVDGGRHLSAIFLRAVRESSTYKHVLNLKFPPFEMATGPRLELPFPAGIYAAGGLFPSQPPRPSSPTPHLPVAHKGLGTCGCTGRAGPCRALARPPHLPSCFLASWGPASSSVT